MTYSNMSLLTVSNGLQNAAFKEDKMPSIFA